MLCSMRRNVDKCCGGDSCSSKMASIGFRWLDILEKEFDKAFVDLDLTIGELESDEPNVVFNVRQKLCTLSSCFAQLTHKAQTIFQNSAKIEAELIHMRAELTESKSKREVLESELHHLLLQLHSSQLSKLPDSMGGKRQDQHFIPDVNAIKKKLEAEIRQSPLRRMSSKESDELKFSSVSAEPAQHKAEVAQLQSENAALRNQVLSLTSEVYGAKLAAKYLDKELAGRIQQLQLLGRDMRGEIRDKLWRQLEAEILLQRHKTVVRACRRNSALTSEKCSKPDGETIPDRTEHFGDIRTVLVKRQPDQGLGISITGGREHGVPILISELESNGPAALSEQLYIGDAILSVNDIDLRNACHREAVGILQQQTGDCALQVQYVAADDSDNSLEEDGFNYRFFDEDVCEPKTVNNHRVSEEMVNTPTAPRTPDSTLASRLSQRSPEKQTQQKTQLQQRNSNNTFNYDPINNIRNNNDKKGKESEFDGGNNQGNNNDSSNNNRSPEVDIYDVDTNDLILLDNVTNNIIKLENFKKVDVFSTIDNNCNTSTNSLNSENLSSPMQTSTDVYLDSEILSTDLASNDSQSPKNLQTDSSKKEIKTKPDLYRSNDSLSNPKSDQSLLNSGESCDSSPLHKASREYKKQRKHKKKYFGVKTLQSIFNKHDGYSDISTTASELGEDPQHDPKPYPDPTQQFEENIHNLLSDIFLKNFPEQPPPANVASSTFQMGKPMKKYFSLHGQNLRVGKALRLCPNEDYSEMIENEQRKEKLLARYVYKANSLNADGVGDPDFGTPV